MSDLISRQAALDALEKSKEIYFDRQVIIGAMKGIVRSLPSAQLKSYRSYREGYQAGFNEGYQAGFKDSQPGRMRGTWIIKDNPGTGWYRVTCSECGEDVTSTAPCIGFYPNAKVTWDYCPNCGADMREVDE